MALLSVAFVAYNSCNALFTPRAGLVKMLFGTYKVTYQPEPDLPAQEVDFTPPFKRIDLYEGLKEHYPGADFPPPETLHTEESRLKLVAIAENFGVQCGEPKTAARLLDKASLLSPCVVHCFMPMPRCALM